MIFDDNSKIIFCQIFIKTYVVGVLIRIASARAEAILTSTHNIGFYEEISKIIT